MDVLHRVKSQLPTAQDIVVSVSYSVNIFHSGGSAENYPWRDRMGANSQQKLSAKRYDEGWV
ncbi:hypothetical protein J6590_056070 [Homalodisca vitripennis]|nr:hypothetical protein J6590_056070 [Homalodisca vitripennis]